ncbi:MAG: META domain-containing protein [Fluviicoccus sp.]|uniref:META domain-containing protein n=1 Tax=Fluviicoccus sp. TaxID=2003552 RepID=UPI0027233950|nr:META domain-containing protein [Fluviicoccus sp.]MDO8330694.1 META domain-containing protein [Fluviicoccus sp.]
MHWKVWSGLVMLALSGCSMFQGSGADGAGSRVMTITKPMVTYGAMPPVTQVSGGDRSFVIESGQPTISGMSGSRPMVIPAMLENTRWEMRMVSGTAVVSSLKGKEPFVKFQQGRLEGFSGCNLFNGRYKRDINNLIRVLEVRGSVLKCEGMEVQEKALVKSLMHVRTWALTPQQSLQFKDAAGGVLAVFEAVYPKQ